MSEDFDFSEAYKKIEKINKWFQKDEVDLNKALEKYKKGMKLINQCKERLKETENEFKKVKEEFK